MEDKNNDIFIVNTKSNKENKKYIYTHLGYMQIYDTYIFNIYTNLIQGNK